MALPLPCVVVVAAVAVALVMNGTVVVVDGGGSSVDETRNEFSASVSASAVSVQLWGLTLQENI